jgi:hypothetical protein
MTFFFQLFLNPRGISVGAFSGAENAKSQNMGVKSGNAQNRVSFMNS